jgi:CDP-diacylglycerol--serine O-phosphatidyltransferase
VVWFPGIIDVKLMSTIIGAPEIVTLDDWSSSNSTLSFNVMVLRAHELIYNVASCYRLAKFNIDEDQQTYFKGL